ncbi:hypothetical protein TNCV_2219801 [Trichonephila clavipes]|nr:hypothetical protein TNCV_2219801 [Trichonephila clavipes]
MGQSRILETSARSIIEALTEFLLLREVIQSERKHSGGRVTSEPKLVHQIESEERYSSVPKIAFHANCGSGTA